MTRTHAAARRTAPTAARAEAESLLRDLAFVLKMTRSVKDEMAADRPLANRIAGLVPAEKVAR